MTLDEEILEARIRRYAADGVLYTPNKRINQDRGREVVEYLKTYKIDRGCSKCGYKEHPSALHFHHKDPSTKACNPYQCLSIDDAMKEVDKCVILCANCHAVMHAKENIGKPRHRERLICQHISQER
jgi:hypothetical protein